MTPEQFVAFADPLPEPMFLLSASGKILAGNRAVEQRLSVVMLDARGKNLSELQTDSPEETANYLRNCSRSRSMVLGSLNMLAQNGDRISCRAEGALVAPRTAESEAILLLRVQPKDRSVGEFAILNERIEALGREVHRRQNAEAEARRQAEQLQVTLQSIGDGVIVTDVEARVRLINPIAQSMTGWSQHEAMSVSLNEVFHIVNEETREPVDNPAFRALNDGVIVGLANHTILIAKDGDECPIDDSAAPIRDGERNVVGCVLVFRDVRERRQADIDIRESESRFRQLADAMPQIVWTARADGNIDYMNRQWCAFTGLPETLGNKGWEQILHPDESQQASERWATSVRTGASFEMELRLRDRQRNTYLWHLIRSVAAYNETGEVVRWFGTCTNIDDQKRAQESSRFLAEASAALSRVVDYESTLQKVVNLAVPYFADWSAVDVVNEDGTLRRLAVAHQDPAKVCLAKELSEQYPSDSKSSSGAYAVLRSGEPEIVAEITDEMLIEGTQDERHLSLIRSLGLRAYICVPLVISSKILGVLTFVTAESGRTYTESDLELAKDLAYRAGVAIENTQLYQALRDADRRKDEFLATLAHELRNPLAPIRNSLQILKMPGVDEETNRQTRDMMERQVHHLVRLVDDLLDVSRVMRGKIELRKERVELATVVARAVETVQPLISTMGHDLNVMLPPESIAVEADPVRLAQVVGNLLANSAKYTESNGHIWLTAERECDQVLLRVRDNGIGLAPTMLPHIFELFVQVDSASTKSQGGLGIGLTLVRNLVQMHNGSVEARSAGLGRGSEFIVRLPISKLECNANTDQDIGSSPQRTRNSSGHSLLIVDDNQDAANTLAILLRLQGHEVRVAHSGHAALELAQAYTPDVVFLDIGMPGMDGYEVARRLRQQPGMQKLVLAALTGWGQKEDRRRTAEAGFDHHLVKPPEPKAVENILAALKHPDVQH